METPAVTTENNTNYFRIAVSIAVLLGIAGVGYFIMQKAQMAGVSSGGDAELGAIADRVFGDSGASAAGGVKIYKNGDYTGKPITLGPGHYDFNQLMELGIINNSIGSVRVPKGFYVSLYSGKNFDNQCLSFGKDVSRIGIFNKKTMSMVIENLNG